MAESGTVLVSSAGPNIDGTEVVRLIKASVSSLDDIQTLQLIGGMDHSPVPNSTVLILDIGGTWKLAIPLTDGTIPTALPGEKYLYSQLPNGTIIASMKLKVDGSIVFNDGLDSAVAFIRMKAAFDTLKSELNTFIGVFNSHTGHTTGVVVPATPAVPAAADMAGATSPLVKIP